MRGLFPCKRANFNQRSLIRDIVGKELTHNIIALNRVNSKAIKRVLEHTIAFKEKRFFLIGHGCIGHQLAIFLEISINVMLDFCIMLCLLGKNMIELTTPHHSRTTAKRNLGQAWFEYKKNSLLFENLSRAMQCPFNWPLDSKFPSLSAAREATSHLP